MNPARCNNILKKTLIIFLFLFAALPSYSQKFTQQITFDAFTGQHILKTGRNSALNRNFTLGGRASFGWMSNGRKLWQQKYGYPEWGVSLMYINYRNPDLGQTFAVTGFYNFHIIPPEKLVNLDFRIDLGVAVHTNPYDSKKNPYNIAIGSRITTVEGFSLNLSFRLDPCFRLGLYGEFMHMSNGNTHCPNYGMNLINAGVRGVYSLTEWKKNEPQDSREDYRQPYRFNINVMSGVNQPYIPTDKYYPFYVLYMGVQKRYGVVSGVNLGLDFSYSTSKAEYAKICEVWYNETPGNGLTLALYAGYEFFLGKISGNVGVGYYLYNNMQFDERFYERLQIKYYINRRIYLNFGLKASVFLAEALEYGVGFLL